VDLALADTAAFFRRTIAFAQQVDRLTALQSRQACTTLSTFAGLNWLPPKLWRRRDEARP
jgi:hypothetical protein